MTSDYRIGRVQVRWRPGVAFDLVRLKAALFTWRGGVRFQGADVVAAGTVETWQGRRVLRAGDGQLFELRAGRGASLPSAGERVRVTGEVAVSRRAGEAPPAVATMDRRQPGGQDATAERCELTITVSHSKRLAVGVEPSGPP